MTPDGERYVVHTAECPVETCTFVVVVEDPATPYEVAHRMAEHVNAVHDEDDLDTIPEMDEDEWLDLLDRWMEYTGEDDEA